MDGLPGPRELSRSGAWTVPLFVRDDLAEAIATADGKRYTDDAEDGSAARAPADV